MNTDFQSFIKKNFIKLHYPFLGYICLQCIMNIKYFEEKLINFEKLRIKLNTFLQDISKKTLHCARIPTNIFDGFKM